MEEKETNKSIFSWEKVVSWGIGFVIALCIIGVLSLTGTTIKRAWFYHPIAFLDDATAIELLSEEYSTIICDIEAAIESGDYRISEYELHDDIGCPAITIVYHLNSPVEFDEAGDETYTGVLAHRMLRVNYAWSDASHKWRIRSDGIYYVETGTSESIPVLTILDAISAIDDSYGLFPIPYPKQSIMEALPTHYIETYTHVSNPQFCDIYIKDVQMTYAGDTSDIILQFRYDTLWEKWVLDNWGEVDNA